MSYGSPKSSSGPSESESSAASSSSGSSMVSSSSGGDGPPWPPDGSDGSSSSGSSSSSSGVDCICDVVAIHDQTTHVGTAYQVDFIVTAAGTCDVTIIEFRSSFGGAYDFTSVPQFLLAGSDGVFTYTREGDPSGDEIIIRFVCENGHEDEIGFTVP